MLRVHWPILFVAGTLNFYQEEMDNDTAIPSDTVTKRIPLIEMGRSTDFNKNHIN
jgi:hypothetical protein